MRGRSLCFHTALQGSQEAAEQPGAGDARNSSARPRVLSVQEFPAGTFQCHRAPVPTADPAPGPAPHTHDRSFLAASSGTAGAMQGSACLSAGFKPSNTRLSPLSGLCMQTSGGLACSQPAFPITWAGWGQQPAALAAHFRLMVTAAARMLFL